MELKYFLCEAVFDLEIPNMDPFFLVHFNKKFFSITFALDNFPNHHMGLIDFRFLPKGNLVWHIYLEPVG